MLINRVVLSIPPGDLENPEHLVLGAVFEEEDLDSLDVDRDSIEFDELYLNGDEFNNVRKSGKTLCC